MAVPPLPACVAEGGLPLPVCYTSLWHRFIFIAITPYTRKLLLVFQSTFTYRREKLALLPSALGGLGLSLIAQKKHSGL